MKSIGSTWISLSQSWFTTGGISGNVDHFYTALEKATEAINIVTKQGDIGSLSLPVQLSELETHNENRRKIVSFCNGIHYEIYKLVDNPFCLSMSQVLERIYALNPKDIKVTTGHAPSKPTTVSLEELISSTITDKALRNDFLNRCKALDQDVISDTLRDVIKEAVFWQREFQKASDCARIANEIFNDEVREKWPNMTSKERKQLATEYVNRIGIELKERNWWDEHWDNDRSVVTILTFGLEEGYGRCNFVIRKVELYPDFVNNPTGNYSLDNMIETLTHEVRHAYQGDVRMHPDRYGIPVALLNEWKQKYILPQDDYTGYYSQPVEYDARAFTASAHP